MNKLIRKIVSFLLVILLLSTSGCWNKREIQTLTINSALGFDRITIGGQSKILLSVLTVKPSRAAGGAGGIGAEGGGQTQAAPTGQVISITGETIQDAVRNWGQRSSRQLFMGHTVLFVIGESFARQGIGEVIDFGTRNRDIPERAMVVVCEGTAQDCLQAQSEFEPLLATEVYNILGLDKYYTSKTKGANLFQVMYDLVTPGKETSMAYLKTFTPPEKGSAVRQVPATDGETGGSNQPQQKVFTLTGAAAFRGEKLAGRLNEEETQGLLFIKDEAYGGIIPIAYDSTRKNISFLFRDVKTKLTPVIKKEGITFQIKIKGTGEVIGTTPQTIDITKKSNVNKMEGLINQEVEQRCRNSVAKAQAMRVDLFGFGDRIHRTYPQVWKEIENHWDDIFPHIDVDIKAEFSVEHSGLTDKSLEIN